MLHKSLGRSKKLYFSNEIVEVWKDVMNDHTALFAARNFQPGEMICEFEASAVLKTPSTYTIQKSADEHICLQPLFLQYTNHSCSPNIFFDLTNWKIICIKQIDAGNELTYFYPSTEWEMAEPFHCHCGNSNCLHHIRGAAFIPEEILSRYRLSEFIMQQLKTR